MLHEKVKVKSQCNVSSHAGVQSTLEKVGLDPLIKLHNSRLIQNQGLDPLSNHSHNPAALKT